MELHKLLIRQLDRLNLDLQTSPANAQQWQEFLERVNTTYIEEDHERYLLERSMKISSQELGSLFEKLSTAQQIAKLGYWSYSLSTQKIHFSRELSQLLGMDMTSPFIQMDEFVDLIYEADRSDFRKVMGLVVSERSQYECELRIKYHNEGYRWFLLIAQSLSSAAKEYDDVVSGILMDITKRKSAEEQADALQEQLLESCRYAGMADIAAATLHNVGNVLNSAHVSVELLREYALKSELKNYDKVKNLLDSNAQNLPEYFSQDEKGKLIPAYLVTLFSKAKKEYEEMVLELDKLGKHMVHINEILMAQNNISRKSGISEKVFLPQLVDQALEMSDSSFDLEQIKVVKEYHDPLFLIIDKVKVLQILVNLIRNAKEALHEAQHMEGKVLAISIVKDQVDQEISIRVRDNGIGIMTENLDKLFSFGFTTKKKGHGYGLHMSALNAKELGGSLVAESNGFDKGASFTLTFPLQEPSQRSDRNREDL